MDALWPWLAMAGMGALHGCVAATRRTHALQMLLPLAAGHAAAVAWVLAGALGGLALPQALAWVLGLAVIIGLAARQWRQRHAAVHASLALGCFLVSLLHGAGLMLVPALAPLCLGGPAPGQGAALWTSPVLLDVLAAMAAHLAAMLAVAAAAGTVAGLASRGAGACALSAARPCTDAGGH